LRPSTPSGPRSSSPTWTDAPAFRLLQRVRGDVSADVQEADHAAVSRVQAAGLPALSRPPPALAARIYEINLSRCIFCGYCELACPFDAITLEAEYEISEYSRDDLIYTKDMLLAEPVKRMPVADRELYDSPVPVWKSES
jgi:ferredoxin